MIIGQACANIVSVARIPLGVALLWAATSGEGNLAALMFILGVLTDIADGQTARRWGRPHTPLGEALQSICTLIFAVAAAAGLMIAGEWGWEPLAAAGCVAAFLQIISWKANDWWWAGALKPVQRIVHPFFSIMFLMVEGAWYITPHWAGLVWTGVASGILFMMASPPPCWRDLGNEIRRYRLG